MELEILGCDTFVVLPPCSSDCVIFGKNSDRPDAEVQEVVFYPSKDNDLEDQLQCTYITIPQVCHTNSVILSRPSWLWGAEMGANQFGVCIGNEAVWTKLTDEEKLKEEKLLGMDLVRLGLERGKTAAEALDVIVDLLMTHGQGGACNEEGMTYDNSFLICDRKEAWILETAGHLWVAQQITEGVRNISNELSIRTKFQRNHRDMYQVAKEKGLWREGEPFDFAEIFSPGGVQEGKRMREGRKMLKEFSNDNNFRVNNMMNILRNKESEICIGKGGFSSNGSQVSLLGLNSRAADWSMMPACHWFTATPDPSKSLYKPFVFTKDCSIGSRTISPDFGVEDPRLVLPRFRRIVDRRHPLWRAHENVDEAAWKGLVGIMREMEANCIKDMEDAMRVWSENEDYAIVETETMGSTNVKKLAEIFTHLVDIEMNFYRSKTQL